MKKKLGKLVPTRRNKSTELVHAAAEGDENVPRITNETVAVHREEVLKGARKYIYPLQHSKHRIVLITTGIVLVTMLLFLSYCVIALYKLKSSNAFLYRVTQVIPFPVARTGSTMVYYENYLFELRHYTHYYEKQLQQNLTTEAGKPQLEQYKQRALQQVTDEAYIKQLAKENKVSVSDQEVKDRIQLVKEQNRLGSNDRVFEDVLKNFWGWSTRDFERSLKQQILTEKVVAKLDTSTTAKANAAAAQVKAGADFAALAKQVSEDPAAKTTGGEYGFAIDKTSRDVPPQVVDALFSLQAGGVSGVINTGTTLEVVKVIEVNAGKVRAAHIVFNLKDVSDFINNLKEKQPVRTYIKN